MLSIRLLAILLLLFSVPGIHAETPSRTRIKAPPLRTAACTEPEDLGTWDDALVIPERDYLVLRRGAELYSLPLVAAVQKASLKSTPDVRNSRMTGAAAIGDRLWVFASSEELAPFALDVLSGDVARFEIPGLKVPGSQAPGIQSHVVVPHASGAVFMVAGGDKTTWPRDGNRPIYFWMDMNSGKIIRFPNGWDLDYFSPDEQVAVFGVLQENPLETRPRQAIDMHNGAAIKETPDRRKALSVPFTWTETEAVKPLYECRAGMGDAQYFAGLSFGGRAMSIEIDLEGRRYLAQAKANDGFFGFRLRREGASRGEPSTYWIAPNRDPEKPERLSADVTDFALLSRGHGVFVTAPRKKRILSEAWGYAPQAPSKWNILDGVERLPPLDQEFIDADYIADRMTIQLVDSCGQPNSDSLVLCMFTHNRGDQRALTPLTETKTLKSVVWRRSIVLTSAGQRYSIPAMFEGNPPDQIWLHHSGRIIQGRYQWVTVGDQRMRQIQLTGSDLRWP